MGNIQAVIMCVEMIAPTFSVWIDDEYWMRRDMRDLILRIAAFDFKLSNHKQEVKNG